MSLTLQLRAALDLADALVAPCVSAAKAGNVEGLAKHFAQEEHPFAACMAALAEQYPDEAARRAVCGKVKALIGVPTKKLEGSVEAWSQEVRGAVDRFYGTGISGGCASVGCWPRDIFEDSVVVQRTDGRLFEHPIVRNADGVLTLGQGIEVQVAYQPVAKIDRRPDVSAADKARAAAEYGTSKWADPVNKKYPIDTEEHVRAALAYIGMPKNREKYGAAELKTIEGRIRAAAKRFGIEAAKADGGADARSLRRVVAFKRQDGEQQIAYAEVYAPYDVDSQGEYMGPEDLALMAHRFLTKKMTHHIDVMHDNCWGRAVVVESFVARKGDPDFAEGAWVLGVHFPDARLWQAVKSGELSGLSFQALVHKTTEEVDVPDETTIRGTTRPALGDGHTHAYVLKVDPYGNVLDGQTEPANGHAHAITENVRTAVVDGHRHTFQMARPIARALGAAA